MPKKNWSSQFEGRFPNLDDETDPQPSLQEANVPGWAWETDRSGILTSCTPEVEAVLGYRPAEVTGQSLATFALEPESASKLQLVLEAGRFPAEVMLTYRSRARELVPITLFIFSATIEGGESKVFRGFAQRLVESQAHAPSSVELNEAKDGDESRAAEIAAQQALIATGGAEIAAQRGGNGDLGERPDQQEQQSETQPTLLASQKVLQILESFLEDSEIIASAPSSRITIEQREEFIDDRTRPPIPKGSLGGRDVHTYPKILVEEIVHRLEWGAKLDFSDDQKKFLDENKFATPGLRGRLRRRMAPQQILKCDLNWIAVVIRVERDRASRLELKFQHAGKKNIAIELDQFLEDPGILDPAVEMALNYPLTSFICLYKGKDYLI